MIDEYLKALRRTFDFIKADYPNASPEYKMSSFVIGAQDMAMMLVYDLPYSEQIAFARKVDALRNEIFPTGLHLLAASNISRAVAELRNNSKGSKL